MSEQKWQETRIDLIRKYYVEIYGEEPRETYDKEKGKGRSGERRVFKKMDICVELFSRSLWRPQRNRRKCFFLDLKEHTSQERFFFENLLIDFVLEGRLPTSIVRTIDFDIDIGQYIKRKKESNPGLLASEEVSGGQAENIPGSRPEAESN